MNAKQAFTAVREAQARVNDRTLKISELSAIKREVLGWDGPVAKFRKFADEQLKTLPRGDKTKKSLRRQKADLSKAAKALRESIDTYATVLRSQRVSKRDNKSAIRFNKAIVQVEDAVRRMLDIDRGLTEAFLMTQLERCVVLAEVQVPETADETVEVAG